MSGRPIGEEAVFTVPPEYAASAWTTAMDMAEDLQRWTVYPQDESDRVAQLLASAESVCDQLPDDLVAEAHDFNEQGNEWGAMIVQGLTPPDSVREVTLSSITFPDGTRAGKAAGLMAIAGAMAFGPPITYTSQIRGAAATLIASVGPVMRANFPLSSGQELGWHAEVGSSPLRPDVLSLFCIRGHPDVETGVLPAARVIEQLSPRTRAVLEQPIFLQPDGLVADSSSTPLPVITDVEGRPGFTCNLATRTSNSTIRSYRRAC